MAFHFKQFSLSHDRSTMKIGTDAVLLAAFTEVEGAQSLLDIGCGCGVVAFCIAQQMAQRQQNPVIYGIDADASSVNEAQDNTLNFNVLHPSCFHFLPVRLQDWVSRSGLPHFDLIVSNPPFFSHDLKPIDAARLKSKHRDEQLPFEDLIDGVDKLLADNGRFVLILPVFEAQEFHRLASARFALLRRIIIKPTVRKPAHRIVLEYARRQVAPTRERTFTIRDADNSYTHEYLQCVQPYLVSVK